MQLKDLFFAEPERKRFRHATFSPAVSVMGEAAESIWRRVNMAIVESSLRFTTIVHESFMFSFKKSLFTLEFQMPKGQNVSRLLATSFKILVANTQSLVALATSESQFRTLCKLNGSKWKLKQNYHPIRHPILCLLELHLA